MAERSSASSPTIPATSASTGSSAETAAADGRWDDHDVYVSGPPAMIRSTVRTLGAAGVPPDSIQHDPLT